MERLKCEDCGEVFDEPEYKFERVGTIGGDGAYQPFAHCPNCGSDSIIDWDELTTDEAIECLESILSCEPDEVEITKEDMKVFEFVVEKLKEGDK